MLAVAEEEQRDAGGGGRASPCRSSASWSPSPRARSTRKIGPRRRRGCCRNVLSPRATQSVSPVGSKKKVRKSEPGSQAMFSGRLNGVAPACLAAALASNEGHGDSFGFDVWMVTHLIGNDVPGVCSRSWALDEMSASTGAAGPPNTIGWAVDDDLQRLQLAAVLDALRIVRHVAVDERVRLGGALGGEAGVLEGGGPPVSSTR